MSAGTSSMYLLAVQTTWVVPFLAPMIGAFAAFMLNRGSRLRRARAAALDDLQLHERAAALFGSDDPLIDQIEAHARESVRTYHARRAADSQRSSAWLSRAAVVGTSVVLGASSIALSVDSVWAFLALGVIGGVVGIAAEAGLERRGVRRALKGIPTGAISEEA